MELIPLAEIVDQKRDQRKEVLVILFEKCNLACSFCHQDHSDYSGFFSVEEKADGIIKHHSGDAGVTVNVTGGEIFLDEFGPRTFERYRNFALKIANAIPDHEITFVSNLVFNRRERVLKLLEDLRSDGVNVSLGTSYDPCGRFTRQTKKTFHENLVFFQDWVKNVSMVITKQNAQWFIDEKTDPVFEFIEERFGIFFDHYTPGPDFRKHQPTDADIADMYIAVNRHYPNVEPLKGWREREVNSTTCRSTVVVTPSSEITTCRSLITIDPVTDEYKGNEIKHQAEANFMEKFGCLECEYYQRCGLRCFLHSEFVDNQSNVCHFKRMFDDILV